MKTIVEYAEEFGYCHVFEHDDECIDVFKVWNLIEGMSSQLALVSELVELLNEITWTYLDKKVNPWSAALDEPHYTFILEADLSFPIILADNAVVDGCHRLMKAFLLNMTKIPIVMVDWALLVAECQYNESDYKEAIA